MDPKVENYGNMRKLVILNLSKFLKMRLPMFREQILSQTMCKCKYRIASIPKSQKKVIFEKFRKYVGEIFRQLARKKEYKVVKGHQEAVQKYHPCFLMRFVSALWLIIF